ncbi:hypothetical protein FACS1894184_16710 [Clostridia bacterium]|nr:hypothetical protein FACS1894184_16710 [Clostridia bacterium]
MKKTLIVLLVVSIVCLMCAVPTLAASAPVTVEFWHIYPVDEDAAQMALMLEKFKSEHPNVTVKELGLSFWDYLEKLAPALAAGTSPDLMIGDLGNPKARAMNGQILNIEKYVQESGLDKSIFLPAALEQCTFEGDLYGLCLQSNSTYRSRVDERSGMGCIRRKWRINKVP